MIVGARLAKARHLPKARPPEVPAHLLPLTVGEVPDPHAQAVWPAWGWALPRGPKQNAHGSCMWGDRVSRERKPQRHTPHCGPRASEPCQALSFSGPTNFMA